MNLLIKPVHNNVIKYYKNHSTYHEGDAGLDLFCLENIVIPAHKTVAIDLGVQCETDTSYYLYPRSSISKTPLRLANSVGIIDKAYRGNIIAMVDNISDNDYIIEEGQRLFQICSPALVPISFKLIDNLSETTRGSGGFGSTGK